MNVRSTRVIRTPDGPLLASPINAHSVEPGDVLLPLDGHAVSSPTDVLRVLSVRRIDAADVPASYDDEPCPWTGPTVAVQVVGLDGHRFTGYTPVNDVLMRAVGARAARGGAR